VAPELLLNKPFDGYAVDLFAAGVMLFVMLLGSEALFVAPLPEDRKFQDICVEGNLKELLQRMESKHSKSFSISIDATDLLQKMLRAEPKDRLSLSQIQQHAWVTQGGADGATAPKSRVELSSGLTD
jgi:serine/threonine protein kinase